MLIWLLVGLAAVVVVLVAAVTVAVWRMLWRVRNQPEFPPYRPTGVIGDAAGRVAEQRRRDIWRNPRSLDDRGDHPGPFSRGP
ncbi:hypothetical protein [Amycolatopsis japonica]|uniref:hypothetical protein n=1 Tax=Amycolatopsis japonica TaxID=208439 RepID=UPI003405C544